MAIVQVPPVPPGSQTLLSTTNLSGATTIISGIPQTYKDLKIIVRNVTVSSARLKFRINGSDSLSTTRIFYSNLVSSSTDGAVTQTDTTNPDGFLYLYDYANTTYGKFGHLGSESDGTCFSGGTMFYNSTSAVTSINIFFNGSTPSAGSVLIYGVN